MSSSLLSKKQDISIQDVSRHFNKPIDEASRELGICVTLLKRVCRKNGIIRWPHRRLKYLDRRLLDYQSLPTLSKEASDEVERLKKAREEVLNGLKVELTVSEEPAWPASAMPAPGYFLPQAPARVLPSPQQQQQPQQSQPQLLQSHLAQHPSPLPVRGSAAAMMMMPLGYPPHPTAPTGVAPYPPATYGLPLAASPLLVSGSPLASPFLSAPPAPLASRTYPPASGGVDLARLVSRFVDFGATIRAASVQPSPLLRAAALSSLSAAPAPHPSNGSSGEARPSAPVGNSSSST